MNCELVRDLLPMYADLLLSESNAGLVSAHLKTCPDCRRQLAQMQEPVEDISIDEAIRDIMVSRRREATKKGIITGILVVVLLGLLIGGWLYLEFRFGSSRYKVVSTNPELILSEVPELALTEEEIYLGQIIFSLPQIAEAEPAPGMTTTHVLAIPKEITNVFPEVKLVETWECYAVVHYQTGDYRGIITYYDGDLTGNADSITKSFRRIIEASLVDTTYSTFEDRIYSVIHYPGIMETEYEKSELKHIWFGFLHN